MSHISICKVHFSKMIRHVGIEGGSSVCELGPVADVALFLECIDMFNRLPQKARQSTDHRRQQRQLRQ